MSILKQSSCRYYWSLRRLFSRSLCSLRGVSDLPGRVGRYWKVADRTV